MLKGNDLPHLHLLQRPRWYDFDSLDQLLPLTHLNFLEISGTVYEFLSFYRMKEEIWASKNAFYNEDNCAILLLIPPHQLPCV